MKRLSWSLLAIPLVLGGCGSGSDQSGGGPARTQSIFVVPGSLDALSGETFFDQPWPSDLRYAADGAVDFAGYPNPRRMPLIDDYVQSMKGILHGFSPAASGFLRFTAALDPASLPKTPLDALDPASSVQLIDIDPASPDHGMRQRVSLFFRAEQGTYWQPDTLAFMPAFGYPLAPHTRYALVVTDQVRDVDGGRVVASRSVRELLGIDPTSGATASAAEKLAGAVGEIAKAGIDKRHIAHFTVFTTDAPIAQTIKIRDWVLKNYPAPDVTSGSWVAKDQTTDMDVYEAEYGPSPDFQKGQIPFIKYGDGGELAFDANGAPVKQRDFNLRFALSVPIATTCPMPAGGYPIMLYAHGTGGDYRTFVRSGVAKAFAQRCIAVMGIDQIFHGTRPGGPCSLDSPPCNTSVDLIFFNVQNPTAARANGPESAIDVVQQARLFTETGIQVPAAVSRTGSAIAFNGKELTFMGHSQGGLNGPMFLAIDNQARGGVLSGSGSMISISILEKTKPVNVAGLVKTLMGLATVSEQQEVNPFHPGISLIQTIVDPTDPIHYVPHIVLDPRSGFSPKSVLMTEGVESDGTGDNYTPPHSIEVESVALGLPPANPVIHPVAENKWGDLSPVDIPAGGLSGNLAGGAASGVLSQWHASQASDGHFVVFDIPAAMQQASGFVRNLVDDPKGRVPAP